MALVHAFLAPTASGDGAGARYCAPLPPSPHFSAACPERLANFLKIQFFFTLFNVGDLVVFHNTDTPYIFCLQLSLY
jgi:hypothetical protein